MVEQPSPRILCMEDDCAIAQLLKTWLERSGYSVDLAFDGVEGLEKYRQQNHDALLVDYSMPRCDGLEVVRSLAAAGRLPPTVFLTATGSETVAVEVMRLGAADYIVKDAQGTFLNRLSTALAHALEVQRLQTSLIEQRSLFTTILANIPHSVFWKDTNSVFLGCNANFARDAGLAAPEEIVGKTDDDLTWKAQAGFYRKSDRQVLDTGKAILNLEESQTREDGEATVLTSKVPLRSPSGDIFGVLGIYIDISDRKHTEESLTRRLEAARLINTVSTRFAEIELAQLDDAINDTLARIGDYLGADRVTTFLFDETSDKPDLVLQWRSAGVASTVELCEGWFLEEIATWMSALRNGEAIHVPDVCRLPPEQARERCVLETHGVQALLMMPTLVNGCLRGFVTVAAVQKRTVWQEDDLAVLRVVGEILSGTVQRIEAQESLRRERDFAEALIDNAQAIVVLLDDRGRMIRCNRYMEELTGYTLAELQGKDAIEALISTQDREWARNAFHESLNGHFEHGTICPIVTKDGRSREVQWYEERLRDENGRATSLLIVGHDITERRRTEQELQRKTESLALRVKQINCVHAISKLLEDGDLTIPEILRQAVALIPSAWQHSELACARIILDDLVFDSHDFCETLWRLVAPVFVDDELVGAVDVCYREDTGERPFLPQERELILDIGQRLGKVIERHRAQARVRVLQQQIEYVLGATKTGLCITDTEGRLLFVDRSWQQVYGDPAGQTCHKYFKKSDYSCENCSTAKALKTKQPVVTDETLPLEGDRPVQVTTIPFQNDQGEWLIAKVHVDVSRLKRLERDLSQAQRLEAIGQLAAGIAHEINTPTQYIGDNTRFLEDAFKSLIPVLDQIVQLLAAAKEGAIPESALVAMEKAVQEADLEFVTSEIPKAIHASLDGVDRVATIVRAMKEFSHPGGEQRQAVDLNRMIESTLTVSRNEWKYVADLETNLDPGLPMVQCYPSELNQAVLNLLINAGQAISEVVRDQNGKGKITVQTRRDGEWVEIRIADTGTGIPATIQSRVFEPFFTTKDVGKGTGQGLAIAYNTIVEKHQGTIHFETEVGVQTTFIIRLPLMATIKASSDVYEPRGPLVCLNSPITSPATR